MISSDLISSTKVVAKEIYGDNNHDSAFGGWGLTSQSKTKIVMDQIISDAELDDPENGILLVLEVKEMGGFTSLLNQLNNE